MTPTLRVVLIVVSILTTFMIMRKIRQSKLQIEDSIFWLGFSSILIVFSIFDQTVAAGDEDQGSGAEDCAG